MRVRPVCCGAFVVPDPKGEAPLSAGRVARPLPGSPLHLIVVVVVLVLDFLCSEGMNLDPVPSAAFWDYGTMLGGTRGRGFLGRERARFEKKVALRVSRADDRARKLI